MVRYMLNCVELGCTEMILWAFNWPNATGTERPVYTELVKQFNAHFYARQPLRNRMFRHIG